MAITFFNSTDDAITFKEFVDSITSKIKFGDEDSLLECHNELLMLANNRSFVIDFLNNELERNIQTFQSANSYGEQSYILYDSEAFFVRLTYWPRLSKNDSIKEIQNILFSYEYPHDHNFGLLTAGYKGEGYWTRLWEYDYNSVIGYKGEEVDIKFLENTCLSKGKALYYRPSKDIHLQMPPRTEDSLAINIILKSYKQFQNRQYEFDIENGTIKGIILGSVSAKMALFDLAKLSYNDKTKDLLNYLSENNYIGEVRKKCLETLFDITSNPTFLYRGLEDKDPLISEYFRLKLNCDD